MSNVIVVGAGIVGLSIARALHADGHDICIVEHDPEGICASRGNAGGLGVTEIMPLEFFATLRKLPQWILDPLGPVSISLSQAARMLPWIRHMARTSRPERRESVIRSLAAVMKQAREDFLPVLDEINLRGELCEVGALWCYESQAGFEAAAADRKIRRAHGVVMEELDARAAREMEPALGDQTNAAVFTPQWMHLRDPACVVDAMLEMLLEKGVKLVTGRALGPEGRTLKLTDGRAMPFDQLIIAAGAWSGGLANTIGDRVLLESERGYNTTIKNPGVTITRELIFPERHFVATPMTCGLRIGGAADFRGLDAPPNYRRSAALAKLAKNYIPDLNTSGGKDWMGHRPATPDSLPVIGPSPRRHDIHYAFGHGHVGFTLGPTTGRMIADMIADRPAHVDTGPFSIERFA